MNASRGWLLLETKTVSKEKKYLKKRPHAYARTGSDKTNLNDATGNYGFVKCVALGQRTCTKHQ